MSKNIKPWTMKPCDCGHPSCRQWFVSCTGTDGRVTKEDAELIIATPTLAAEVARLKAELERSLETLVWEVKTRAKAESERDALKAENTRLWYKINELTKR